MFLNRYARHIDRRADRNHPAKGPSDAGGRARQTVVATAGGLSQDGRRRRSPLATAASHERRRGTLHKHWACPGWPSWMGTAAALGGQKAAAGVRRHAAQTRHSPRTWRDIS
jgi:hypothetical protein